MSPQWTSGKITTSVPCADSGRNGSGGALRSTAQTLSSSGARGVEVAPRAQHLARLRERIDDEAGVELGADRMERELERRDDAEVAAAAAQRPEQLGLRRAPRRRAQRAVGGDDASRSAGCRSVRPWRRVSQPKPPPSVRPATPVVELMPSGVARPCACAAAIEVGEQRAGADARGAPRRVDLDGAHRRQVDHQAAFGDGVAGDVVAAAAHAEQHPVRGGEADRRLHVALVQAARDQRRAAIDGGVPDLARVVVAGVAGGEHAAADLRGERLDVGRRAACRTSRSSVR